MAVRSKLQERLERERQLASEEREKRLRKKLVDAYIQNFVKREGDSDYREEDNHHHYNEPVAGAVVIYGINTNLSANKIIECLEYAGPVKKVRLYGKSQALGYFRDASTTGKQHGIYKLFGRYGGWIVREAYNADVEQSKRSARRVVLLRTVLVKNLSYNVSNEDLRKHFGEGIVNVEAQNPRGSGYVMFEEARLAEQAVAQFHHTQWHGRKIGVELVNKELKPAPRTIVLGNMFDPAEETEENWVKDLEEDVLTECEAKYGPVLHLAVEPSPAGEVYVKFAESSMAQKALESLDGRFFGGKRITAKRVKEAVYSTRFPSS